MIYRLSPSEFDSMLNVVNDAAQAYKGVIPEDRWKEPYMPTEELRKEIESGVEFYGWKEDNVLVAVMGIQVVNDVTLIRHAYVLTDHQRRGIGENLLKYLLSLARTSEVLLGIGKPPTGLFVSTRSTGSDWYQKKKRTGSSENTGTFLKGKLNQTVEGGKTL